MDCKFCGKSTPPGFDRCLYCGQSFVESSQPYTQPPKSNVFLVRLRIALLSLLGRFVLPLLLVLVLGTGLAISQCSYNNTESVVFTPDVEDGIPVYADIISVDPTFGTYTTSPTHFNSLICKCETTDGAFIWVKMSTFEYTGDFNPDATPDDPLLRYAGVDARYPSVSFSTPVRIYGKSMESEDAVDGLYEEIQEEMIISFKSRDERERK